MANPRTNAARPTADGVDPIKPVKDEAPAAPAPAEDLTRDARGLTDKPAEATDQTVSEGSAAFATGEKGSFKTSGSFALMDPYTGKHFDENSDAEVVITQFVLDKLNTGELVEA